MSQDLKGERITIEYIPLDKAVLWDENPKSHDIGSLCESIARYGFVDPPKFDAQLGALVYGNGRTIALQAIRDDPAAIKRLRESGLETPRGVLCDAEGNWYVPVKFGIDQNSRDVAPALAVDHNNFTMLRGDFAVWDVAKMWNESYPELLRLLAEAETLPVSVDGDDLDALLAEPLDYDKEWQGMPEFEQKDLTSAYQIIVHLASLEDLRAFAELVGQNITEKTRFIWYPEMEERRFMDKRYIEQS